MENIQKDMQSTAKDNINPDHYKNETSLECIEAMEIIFGQVPVLDFCLCNAWKYIWRWRNKNGLEDLNKAKWYLNRAAYYINKFDGCTESIVWAREYHGMMKYLKENGIIIQNDIDLADFRNC